MPPMAVSPSLCQTPTAILRGTRPLLSLTGAFLVITAPLKAQGMLPGCRLENGSLQCVPGLTATPQQQIQVLDGEIAADQHIEGQIEQTIQGLQRFEVVGQARLGALLTAELELDSSNIETLTVHWYRRSGTQPWQLVGQASERTYQLSQADGGATVMAVVTVTLQNGTVQRRHSNQIGPVKGG